MQVQISEVEERGQSTRNRQNTRKFFCFSEKSSLSWPFCANIHCHIENFPIVPCQIYGNYGETCRMWKRAQMAIRLSVLFQQYSVVMVVLVHAIAYSNRPRYCIDILTSRKPLFHWLSCSKLNADMSPLPLSKAIIYCRMLPWHFVFRVIAFMCETIRRAAIYGICHHYILLSAADWFPSANASDC